MLALTGVVAATVGLTGCGSSTASPRIALSREVARAGSVVYQWGRVGGALEHTGSGRFGIRRSLDLFGRRIHRNLSGILGVGPIRFEPTPVRGIHGTVTQVATSNSTGYALTTTGAVYAWGTGSEGELGNGSTTKLSAAAVRVDFPAGVKIAKLANPMPYDGAMAIDTHGIAWAWGNDVAREFCQPVGAYIDTPVKVPLLRVTLAAGAWRHAIYDAGGKVVSCGGSDHGQLGNGTIGFGSDTGKPVAVEGLAPGRVVALTSAFGNAGALMANGAYYDWGINSSGQVGDGTTTERTTAVRVKLPARVTQVFEGGSFPVNGQTMAILANGQLWVWGANRSGQLGDGTTTSSTRPIRFKEPTHARFVAVSSGGATDYAIGRSGDLWAWGQNSEGQLGDGSSDAKSRTPINGPVRVTQVSATARNVAAIAKARP